MILIDKSKIIKKVALLSNWETQRFVDKLEQKGFFDAWVDMQEGQRRFQAQTGPGRVVANSWSRGGTVDTGNYVGHCCSPSQ